MLDPQPDPTPLATSPLSPTQQRIWALEHLELGDALFQHGLAIEIDGPLDTLRLGRALERVKGRQRALRTVFRSDGARVHRFVLPESHVELEVVHVTDETAEGVARQELERRFQLDAGTPFRARLLRLQPNRHRLLLVVHELVADAESLVILLDQLVDAYAEPDGVGDEVEDQPAAAPEVIERRLAQWTERLQGAPDVIRLPLASTPSPGSGYAGAEHRFTLPAELAAVLDELSARAEADVPTVLLAGFATLLHRYSSQPELVMGVVWRSPTAKQIVGDFSNPVVLRLDFTGAPTFMTVLARVRHELAWVRACEVPFQLLVRALQRDPDLSRNPIFQVGFGMRTLAYERSAGGLGFRGSTPPIGSSRLDMSVDMAIDGPSIGGRVVHRTGVLPAAAAAALAGHLQTLLAAAAANPERPVGGLPLATATELRQMEAWNATARPHDERCIHEFFEATAVRRPDAVALVVGDVRLTYGQLERDANRLARSLQRTGVGAGHRVAVLLSRTQRLVVALLAVLKAGAAYVAVDPEYPPERVRYMLLDSDASLIVTESGLAELTSDIARSVIDLDATADLEPESDARVASASHPSAPAYVIYTSGSTGRPKGVMISHRGVAALIHWSRARLSDRDLSGVLASTSVCFDVSIAEIFVTFACGGCVFLVRNVLSLAEISNRDEITLVSTVPSAMSRLLERQRLPRSLRVLDMGGEALRAELVGRLFQEPGVEVVNNMYGPTEDTTYSTCFSVRRGDAGPVLIGRPVLRTQAYVVDEGLYPLPVGVPGELYLAGDGLALGYWGDPALTAERFLPDALGTQPGRRMYRTGDLFRLMPDGSLDYLGRLDQQVKIRGFRVEPREIEMALLGHDRVADCVVVAREDTPGEWRLVAYYVPTADPAPTVSELRALLKSTFPDYMIPAAFVKLAALPQTPNHKIDRGRLPAPASVRPDLQEPPMEPRTPTERRLTEIWQRLLGIETVGVHDDFFELGGDSLLATELTAAIGSTFQMRLYFRAIFETPTIALMAERVDRTREADAQPEPSQS